MSAEGQAFTTIPCGFCETAIPTDSFAFSSATHRLLQATCSGCGHPSFRTSGDWLRLGGTTDSIADRA